MMALVKKYTNNEPEIICGDFGSQDILSLAQLKYLKILYKEEFSKLNKAKLADPVLQKMLNDFYTNGMTFTNILQNPSPPGPYYTNDKLKLRSNYIISNTRYNYNYFNNTSNATIFNNLVKLYGGILPVSVVFNAKLINENSIVQKAYTQIKGKNYEKVKLYTKAQLMKIVQMIDKLMSHFTYGYKAYLRRDLGCFSFDEDTSSSSPYNIRMYGSIDEKYNFYAMNYPAFIDVFLYQLAGFYNSNALGEVFYSETQVPRGKIENRFKEGLNFLKSKNFEGKSDFIKHTVIRMLLIPSQDLEDITNLKTGSSDPVAKTTGKKGIDTKITSIKNYMQLAKDFSFNFYRNTLIPKFENRLSVLLDQKKFIKKTETDKYKDKAVEKVQSDIINRGLLYQLLQIKQVSGINQLEKINDPKLIQDLFEFIFIMLKLKFIEKEVYEIEKSTLEIDKPVVVNANYAIFGEKYKTKAFELFALWRTFSASHDSATRDKAEKLLEDLKILLLVIPPATPPPPPPPTPKTYTIIQESLIVKPVTTKIKTYLELKHFQAYTAYILMLKIARCLGIINDAVLATKNIKLDDSSEDASIDIKLMQKEAATVVGTSLTGEPITGDVITGETIKAETKILIDNLDSLNGCTGVSSSQIAATAHINAINALISRIRRFLGGLIPIPTLPLAPLTPPELARLLARLESTCLGAGLGTGGGSGAFTGGDEMLLDSFLEADALYTHLMTTNPVEPDLIIALTNLDKVKQDVDAKITEIEDIVEEILTVEKNKITALDTEITAQIVAENNELNVVIPGKKEDTDPEIALKRDYINAEIAKIKLLIPTNKTRIDGIIKNVSESNIFTNLKHKKTQIETLKTNINSEISNLNDKNNELTKIIGKLNNLLTGLLPDVYRNISIYYNEIYDDVMDMEAQYERYNRLLLRGIEEPKDVILGEIIILKNINNKLKIIKNNIKPEILDKLAAILVADKVISIHDTIFGETNNLNVYIDDLITNIEKMISDLEIKISKIPLKTEAEEAAIREEAERKAKEEEAKEAKRKAERKAEILEHSERLKAELAEFIAKEKARLSGLEADRVEAERLRLEAERLRLTGLEADRLMAEKIIADRLKAEEADRLIAKKLIEDRLKAEEESLKAESLKAESLKAESLKAERLKAERLKAVSLKPETEAEKTAREAKEAKELEVAIEESIKESLKDTKKKLDEAKTEAEELVEALKASADTAEDLEKIKAMESVAEIEEAYLALVEAEKKLHEAPLTERDLANREFIDALSNYTEVMKTAAESLENISSTSNSGLARNNRRLLNPGISNNRPSFTIGTTTTDPVKTKRQGIRNNLENLGNLDPAESSTNILFDDSTVHSGGAAPLPAQIPTNPVEIIVIKDKTINNVLEDEYDKGKDKDTKELYILNFASVENIGGQFKDDVMEEEEELLRTSNAYYLNLNDLVMTYNTTNEIRNTTNPRSYKYKIFKVADKSQLPDDETEIELLKLALVTNKIKFNAHDGCSGENSYEPITDALQPEASIITAFWANLGININKCGNQPNTKTGDKAINPDITIFNITEKINQLLKTSISISAETPSPDKNKILIVGTGCFGPKFVSDNLEYNDTKNTYITYIYDAFKNAIVNAIKENKLAYNKIIFTIPKKAKDINADINNGIYEICKNMFADVNLAPTKVTFRDGSAEPIKNVNATLSGTVNAAHVGAKNSTLSGDETAKSFTNEIATRIGVKNATLSGSKSETLSGAETAAPPVTDTSQQKLMLFIDNLNLYNIDDPNQLADLKTFIDNEPEGELLFNQLMTSTSDSTNDIKQNKNKINLIVHFLNEKYCKNPGNKCDDVISNVNDLSTIQLGGYSLESLINQFGGAVGGLNQPKTEISFEDTLNKGLLKIEERINTKMPNNAPTTVTSSALSKNISIIIIKLRFLFNLLKEETNENSTNAISIKEKVETIMIPELITEISKKQGNDNKLLPYIIEKLLDNIIKEIFINDPASDNLHKNLFHNILSKKLEELKEENTSEITSEQTKIIDQISTEIQTEIQTEMQNEMQTEMQTEITKLPVVKPGLGDEDIKKLFKINSRIIKPIKNSNDKNEIIKLINEKLPDLINEYKKIYSKTIHDDPFLYIGFIKQKIIKVINKNKNLQNNDDSSEIMIALEKKIEEELKKHTPETPVQKQQLNNNNAPSFEPPPPPLEQQNQKLNKNTGPTFNPPPPPPPEEKKIKITFLQGTIIEHIIKQKTENRNIIVLNPTELPIIGGKVESGGEGIEEDLIRSSPELYYSLKKLGSNAEGVFSYSNNPNFGETGWNEETNDNYSITTPNAKIYRHDINNNYKVIESQNQPSATFITVSKIVFDKESHYIYYDKIFKSIIGEAIQQNISNTNNILILDPIDLFLNIDTNDKNKLLDDIANWFIRLIEDNLPNLNLEIIFTKPKADKLFKEYKNFSLLFNHKATTMPNIELDLTNLNMSNRIASGGYLNNSKSISKSPKHRKNNKNSKNNKNTKKNNSRKKKSKTNMFKNKSKLSKKN